MGVREEGGQEGGGWGGDVGDEAAEAEAEFEAEGGGGGVGADGDACGWGGFLKLEFEGLWVERGRVRKKEIEWMRGEERR